jgi:3-oxoacyl-[acyl-carrier protein] reductase/pteridine reductase
MRTETSKLYASGTPLKGKCALVTGGARRLGREIARTLAEAGAAVTITYRTSASEAADTVRAVEALGRSAQAVQCDVRKEADVRAAVEAAAALHGRLDILVSNAGVFTSGRLEELTLTQWDEAFQVNARGPFLFAREAAPYLRAAHGRIVNLGSLGGMHAWVGHGHYCASKAAVHMLTQAMAKSFAPEVSVNCVAPGWIEMEGTDGEVAARFAAKTPMRRNGTVADVAEAVLFFAAGPAFVTGQVLAVDGGLGL